MNCVNCGAPMRPVAGGDHFVCDFCATFHFPEKNQDHVTVIGEPGERDCPVCSVSLVSASCQRKPVEYCPKCQGLLVDRRAFNKIVDSLRARHRGPLLEPQPIDPADYERQLRCPACGRSLEVHPYYGPGNVLIDTCGACSLVWLDRGEIATIARS
ncbi:MAG: zf-TFIIB domain-containing protein [Anaerolineae bacterium]